MTTLLVDADGVAFKAASAAQSTYHWDDDIVSISANVETARDIFDNLIKDYQECTEPDSEIILCFSCPSRRYFRHDILPSYKANRKSLPPLGLKPLREWAEATYPTKIKPHLEADDVLGILATHKTLIKGRKIIVSGDKDLDQIPGLHLSTNSPDDGVYETTKESGERFLWEQVLIGDVTDNYKGCPGIGEVKAAKILDGIEGEGQYAAAVLAAFEKALKNDPRDPVVEMTTQVNVARLLTSKTYNFKRMTPKLWSM